MARKSSGQRGSWLKNEEIGSMLSTFYQLQAQLAEKRFFFHFSQEARHQAYQWEMPERAAYDARFRSAESTQERLNMESTVGHHVLVLRQELQTAEQEH